MKTVLCGTLGAMLSLACDGGAAEQPDATAAIDAGLEPDAAPPYAVLFGNRHHPYDLSLDSTHVYWIEHRRTDALENPLPGEILRAPIEGGAVETVATLDADKYITLIGLSDGHVYWKTALDGVITRANKQAGATPETVIARDDIRYAAVVGQFIYFEINLANGREIYRTSLDGNGETLVYERNRWVDPIEVAGDDLHFISRPDDSGDVALYRTASDGSTPNAAELLAGDSGNTLDIAAGNDLVVWAGQPGDDFWMRRLDLQKGEDMFVARETGYLASNILLDEDRAYFIIHPPDQETTMGTLIEVSVETPQLPLRRIDVGGARGKYHKYIYLRGGLAQDDTFLYWTDPGDADRTNGAIYRMPK